MTAGDEVATLTTLLALTKPVDGGSHNTWGAELLATVTALDNIFSDRGTALSTAGSCSAYTVASPAHTGYPANANGMGFRA